MKDIKSAINQRRKGAKGRGISYEIPDITAFSIYNSNRCHYLNLCLNVKNVKIKNLTKLTFDRKDPDKGYVKGNVVACSNIANQLKNLVESGLITAEDIINCGKKIKQALL